MLWASSSSARSHFPWLLGRPQVLLGFQTVVLCPFWPHSGPAWHLLSLWVPHLLFSSLVFCFLCLFFLSPFSFSFLSPGSLSSPLFTNVSAKTVEVVLWCVGKSGGFWKSHKHNQASKSFLSGSLVGSWESYLTLSAPLPQWEEFCRSCSAVLKIRNSTSQSKVPGTQMGLSTWWPLRTYMRYWPVFGPGKSQVNGWQFMLMTKMRLMSEVEFSAGSTR